MTGIATLARRPAPRATSRRIAGPAARLLSTAEAKARCMVEHSADDALIDAFVKAAEDYLDGPAGVTGRALVNQTWRLALSGPPEGDVILPVPPVSEITEIRYVDPDGDEQVFAAENCRLVKDPFAARVELVPGAAWPATDARGEAFWIDYVAGYGAAASAVPQTAVTAAGLLVAHWYAHREGAMAGSVEGLPLGVEMLIAALRTPRSLM